MSIDTKLLKSLTSRLRVLYVEDDLLLREQTSEIFSTLFKELTVAVDGLDGFNQFIAKNEQEKGYFDLVVSDILMPNLSGIEMAKKIVAYRPKQNFIFISAHQDSDYLVNLIDIGVSSFLSKPINFDDLKNVLYKSSVQLEEGELNKDLLHKVLEENEKLKEEIAQLKDTN